MEDTEARDLLMLKLMLKLDTSRLWIWWIQRWIYWRIPWIWRTSRIQRQEVLMLKLDTLEALDLVDTEVDILEDTMDMEDMDIMDTEARDLLMLRLMLKLDTLEA